MTQKGADLPVYLEAGTRKTFAGALDWPGWCRSGRDEASALEALTACGPRYARVLEGTGLGFQPPADASSLVVIERLRGSATTDFGAPGAAPTADALPVDGDDLARFLVLLQACLSAFDQAHAAAAAAVAAGRALRKGPRGGGRDLDGIARHVLEADAAYLRRLGWTFRAGKAQPQEAALHRTRQAILEALRAAARGELPTQGPRGGARWTLRYFVRRVAWHVLDHAWEIEDRMT